MLPLSPAMRAALSGGATTLARCWRLTRRDGLVLGFTDHDRDLIFDGVAFRARTGVEGTEMETELGFAIGGAEIAGALSSEGLAESELAKGLWDEATVEIWLVDWSNAENRVRLHAGSIGEIRRSDRAFSAELRDMSHRLDEERGRLFASSCSADLGDERCRVALGDARFSAVFTVGESGGPAEFSAHAGANFTDGWFTGGRLVWLSGANAGAAAEVKSHAGVGGGQAVFTLWRALPEAIAPGDTARIEAGCDKRFETCRAKFGNILNFRGFPHMPGNDVVLRVASSADPGLDGGSLFR